MPFFLLRKIFSLSLQRGYRILNTTKFIFPLKMFCFLTFSS